MRGKTPGPRQRRTGHRVRGIHRQAFGSSGGEVVGYDINQGADRDVSTCWLPHRFKVVESDTAPKTYVADLLWVAVETGEREPIGARIVEVPDDLLGFESRDPRSTFTAYVPIGSIANKFTPP